MARRQAASAAPTERRLESWAFESQARRSRLLASEGFEVVRWFFEMLRPNLDDIADMPMPDGLEVRPVVPEHHRKIWAADIEAFRDHWGASEESEEAFERFFGPARLPARAVARGVGRRRGRRRGHEPRS